MHSARFRWQRGKYMTEFDYYCDSFGGAEFDSEDEFEPFCERAEQYIKNITCTEPDFDDEDILACVCALAEIYARCAAVAKSEEIDGFEQSFSAPEDELLHTARLYLPPVLMYGGF